MGSLTIDTRGYFIAITLFLALLFTLLSPEGSAGGAFMIRFLQWLLQVAIPLAILIGTHLLLSRWTAFDRRGPWLKLTVSGVVGGLVFSPFALALDFVFGLESWAALGDADRFAAMLAKESASVVPPVALVWVGINAPRVLGINFSRSASTVTPAAVVVTDVGPNPRDWIAPDERFLTQIPASLGRDIVYLMAELHYVRVVTTRGRSLVLYNLRDAIEEMPADTGIQTHRSYWVSFAHLDKWVKREGRMFCLMDDGTEVPVSRRESARVREELDLRRASGRSTTSTGDRGVTV